MRAKQWLYYFVGVQVLALGIIVMVSADLGVSIGTCVAYVLNRRFSFLTLGVWNYLCHGAVMLLLICVLRRVRLSYLVSFGTSVFLGYSMDLYRAVLPDASVWPLAARAALVAFGILAVALGIALSIASGFPPAPFDLFVNELSLHRRWPLAKVKTVFDLSWLALGAALGLLFFGRIIGIGAGTVLSALCTGAAVGFFKARLGAPGKSA